MLDAVWLCKVAERQMLRPSFVPPWPIRRLRDLTRYRTDLVSARTAEKNRVEKLLEDACIKLSVVASDIFGMSWRAMLAALVAVESDPKVLAQLARSRMRGKIEIDRLEQAFNGHFADHHRFLLSRMLSRIEFLDADIAAVDVQVATQLAPFAEARARLDAIPGIGPVAAAIIIAEIGVDMSRFATAGMCVRGRSSPRASTPRPAKLNAALRRNMAVRTWRASWARPRSAPARRTRCCGSLPAPRQTPRPIPGCGRRRPFPPGDHLAPAAGSRGPLPGSGCRSLHPSRRSQHQETHPHPATRSSRLHRHTHARGLTPWSAPESTHHNFRITAHPPSLRIQLRSSGITTCTAGSAPVT